MNINRDKVARNIELFGSNEAYIDRASQLLIRAVYLLIKDNNLVVFKTSFIDGINSVDKCLELLKDIGIEL